MVFELCGRRLLSIALPSSSGDDLPANAMLVILWPSVLSTFVVLLRLVACKRDATLLRSRLHSSYVPLSSAFFFVSSAAAFSFASSAAAKAAFIFLEPLP